MPLLFVTHLAIAAMVGCGSLSWRQTVTKALRPDLRNAAQSGWVNPLLGRSIHTTNPWGSFVAAHNGKAAKGLETYTVHVLKEN